MNNGMIDFSDKYTSITTNKDQIEIKIHYDDNILSNIYLSTNDYTMLLEYKSNNDHKPNCIFHNDSNMIMLYIYNKENLKNLISWCKVFTNYTIMDISDKE